MKPLHCILAIATLAMALPMTAAAQRASGTFVVPNAVGDPLMPIYRGSGVRDDGAASNTGIATAIHCTSFSIGTETVRLTIRNWDNSLLVQFSYTLGAQATATATTHPTIVFDEDFGSLFTPGTIANQGYIAIHATSTNILCSAQVVDAAAAVPNGWDLHLVRFNAMTGSGGE